MCCSRNEKLIIKDCTELGLTQKKRKEITPYPQVKQILDPPLKGYFQLSYNVARLKLLTTRSCFCNHQNLIFSTVSENLPTGARPGQWGPSKKFYRRVRTVPLKMGHILYYFSQNTTLLMLNISAPKKSNSNGLQMR